MGRRNPHSENRNPSPKLAIPHPSQFHRLMNQAGEATATPRLHHLPGRAKILHLNSYNPKPELSHKEISPDIDAMADRQKILYSLTDLEPVP